MEITPEERKRKLQEKHEHDEKRRQLGISKNQYKKLLKQQKWDDTKEQYLQIKREKRKKAKQNKHKNEFDDYHRQKRQKPAEQHDTQIRVVVDCEFDELMNDKEIVSMSNQITRMYSARRHCKFALELVVSSFNKRLKQRFDKAVSQYKLWKNIEFKENEKLEEAIDAKENVVYLTADTDEVIEELQAGHTYVIGGIVDKNRHKKLCVNKAKAMGLKVGKLPIDQYIQLNGRQVLATSHVYEIMCQWFEQGKDWGKAFSKVMPARKVKVEGEEKEGGKKEEEEEAEEEAEEAEEEEKEEEEAEAAEEDDAEEEEEDDEETDEEADNEKEKEEEAEEEEAEEEEAEEEEAEEQEKEAEKAAEAEEEEAGKDKANDL